MNLVLIETSANQRYIFATNKLRENVGASELTFRVGTELVLTAVEEETKKKIYEETDLDGKKLRANLLDKNKNPELVEGGKVEVIIATSGKALLLVEDKTIGEKIIRTVTAKALHEMPGLTVHGAISKPFNEFSGVHIAIGEVHLRLEELRYQIPSNEQRFLRLPFVAPCSTSGLPASEAVFLSKEEREKNEAHRFSEVAWTKRAVLRKDKDNYEKEDEGKPSRIVGLIQRLFNVNLYENLERLEDDFKDLSWIAIIHADGNGLGEIFLNFDKYTGLRDGKCTPREYINKYRRFSLALDVCTINAAGHALENLRQRFLTKEEKEQRQGKKNQDQQSDKCIPVVPLILGGDDLTVLCDGQYALKFVYEFLNRFESETESITENDYLNEKTDDKTVLEILKGIIPEIASKAFNVPRLGICAGVAIVKPHFPFHHAYELAEQLLKSAKQVKEKIKHLHNADEVTLPSSALDFHILYDSAYSELDAIRAKLRVDKEKTWLYAKPYIVSNIQASEIKFKNDQHTKQNKLWFEKRRFSQLEKRVNKMRARDKDDPSKRMLPNNQLHSLREALFLGAQEADARMNLIKQRYEKEGFNELLCERKNESNETWLSMFFDEQDSDKEHVTHFMDALDAVEFWKGFDALSQNGRGNGTDE